MIKRKIKGRLCLCLLLTAAFVLGGCGKKEETPDPGTASETSGAEAADSDGTEPSSETQEEKDPNETDGEPEEEDGEPEEDLRDQPGFSEALAAYEEEEEHPVVEEVCALGQPWVVEGQWKLTVDSAEKVTEEDTAGEYGCREVWIVTYSYENLGFEDETHVLGGLYMYLDGDITDSEGEAGIPVSLPGLAEPRSLEPGEVCTAQNGVGLMHSGDFFLHVTEFANDGTEYQMTFLIPGA